MKLKRKLASMALAGGLAVTGLAATATPASAVGGCEANTLCLYRSTQYRTMSFAAKSTNACFDLLKSGLTDPWNGISSYVNNLPVRATLWVHYDGASWEKEDYWSPSTIMPGSFSSNSSYITWYDNSDVICTGSAVPWN
ncbi:peptidase inhibitor [Streptomyces tanashiensis]|uniref:peptidase inhibitor n=1 Tax=Streptomyces tanashiensis TaxID=67367 RepID=UPI003442E374